MQSTSLATLGAAGTLQNFLGFRAVSGTNDAEMLLPDGGDAVVSTRLSRAAASIYLERRRDPPASSIRFRRFLLAIRGNGGTKVENRFFAKMSEFHHFGPILRRNRFQSQALACTSHYHGAQRVGPCNGIQCSVSDMHPRQRSTAERRANAEVLCAEHRVAQMVSSQSEKK